MQRAKDADHLAIYSDSTYPVGPDPSGEITYIHVPPLNPLTSACKPFIDLNIPPDVCAPVIIVVLALSAAAAFFWCYISPVVRKCRGARGAAKDRIRHPVLESVRSLFDLRPQTPSTTPPMPARYGRLDMRIARPPPAVSLPRGSLPLPSSSLSPLLSSSSSSSPEPSSSSSSSSSPPRAETLPGCSPSASAVPEVIVAPVDVSVLGQTVESRTTPKKGGDHYHENHKAEYE